MKFGWPTTPIGSVAAPIERPETPIAGKNYRQVGVRLWGEGAYERETIDGSGTQYAYLNQLAAGDIIVNKIWARNGSVSVVQPELEGCYCSTEFPLFRPNPEQLERRWLFWMTKTKWFWDQCDAKSRGTSGKNRIRPEQFLQIEIPLPPLVEQQRIVAKIERVAGKVEEAQGVRNDVRTDLDRLLMTCYRRLAGTASIFRSFGEVAPLVRRPADLDVESTYPQVSARSFGKGTFHKPPLLGSEITWQKPYLVCQGDILISNIKAWEGAVAVASVEDNGRYGSHRYLTCVPVAGVATARFLCFHLLTPEGLYQLGEASPGTADRNRTLSTSKLLKIEVPVPSYEEQVWFDKLYQQVEAVKAVHASAETETIALLPAVLDRAFRGEL